jgi:hypothetical protein
VILLLVCLLAGGPAALQDTFTAKELAEYRLAAPVFRQFVHASGLVVAAMSDDPRLRADPLFTRDVAVLDDAVAAAAALEARLKLEPRYVSALRIAGLSAREYTRFALALFGARLAHGFVQAGLLPAVPTGAPADNVAFVAANEAEIADVLKALGLEGAYVPQNVW